MARTQLYSGAPFVKRSAIGTATEELQFPNPTQSATTPGPNGPRPGKSVRIIIQASGANVVVSFNGDTTTHYFTIVSGAAPVVLPIEAERIWIRGTAAGSVYELVAELSH